MGQMPEALCGVCPKAREACPRASTRDAGRRAGATPRRCEGGRTRRDAGRWTRGRSATRGGNGHATARLSAETTPTPPRKRSATGGKTPPLGLPPPPGGRGSHRAGAVPIGSERERSGRQFTNRFGTREGEAVRNGCEVGKAGRPGDHEASRWEPRPVRESGAVFLEPLKRYLAPVRCVRRPRFWRSAYLSAQVSVERPSVSRGEGRGGRLIRRVSKGCPTVVNLVFWAVSWMSGSV